MQHLNLSKLLVAMTVQAGCQTNGARPTPQSVSHRTQFWRLRPETFDVLAMTLCPVGKMHCLLQ